MHSFSESQWRHTHLMLEESGKIGRIFKANLGCYLGHGEFRFAEQALCHNHTGYAYPGADAFAGCLLYHPV